ncbi:SPOR domain-containing protein [Nitrococcus mobilis]|uniref:Argininosuccinate synthase n=1 Tax=Nitrococcus mobilis Nb-231 TaxID=314278 RepID=A4BRW0_9GAMM|nr:SPOR domain-containing protein [Nitrococcus mobilis]EAR21439.1 Argininosuccinate synthase [Nitrococcus mobilis Nb-231]
MEQRAKQRLIGAVILVALGVVFIPMLLQGPVERDRSGIPVEIPPRPQITPVPDVPKAAVLHEPAPGQRLAERPPPIGAPQANSMATANRSASTPVDERERHTSAPVSKSTVSAGVGANQMAAAPRREIAGERPAAAWTVQVGSFRERDNANALRQVLRQSGFSTYIEQAQYRHKPLFRVRIGPFVARDEAEQLAARLHEQRGIKVLVVEK